MKFYALALLALGAFQALADAPPIMNCTATRTTTVTIDDKITLGPITEATETYIHPDDLTVIGAGRYQGLQVALKFSADRTEAFDISNHLDQLGDTRFWQKSTSVPVKLGQDGSVSISHSLDTMQVGTVEVRTVEITLTCKK